MNDVKTESLWLMHGNCLDRMKEIPDGSVDMILADPPFNTTVCKWDSLIPFAEMWAELKRVIKPNSAIVLFGVQPFTTTLIASNMQMFKYCWVWKKSKASNFPHAPNMPLKVTEDVCVFSSGVVGHVSQAGAKRMTYNPQGVTKGVRIAKQGKNTSQLGYHRDSQTNHTTGYQCKGQGYPTVILDFKSENGLHPTQKPVALLEYLIRTYTNEGETVLDFTQGSGSTGIASLNTGRKYIGVEMDNHYFNISKERILATKQATEEI